MHYFGNLRDTQSMVAYTYYDFDWVFLEITVKNCIVGMLLTCPIGFSTHSCTSYSSLILQALELQFQAKRSTCWTVSIWWGVVVPLKMWRQLLIQMIITLYCDDYVLIELHDLTPLIMKHVQAPSLNVRKLTASIWNMIQRELFSWLWISDEVNPYADSKAEISFTCTYENQLPAAGNSQTSHHSADEVKQHIIFWWTRTA